MKHVKKLLALVLVAAMTLTMNMAVFADGIDAPADASDSSSAAPTTYTITFPTDPKYVNHTYEIFQIFTGKLDETVTTGTENDVNALTSLRWGKNGKGNEGDAVGAADIQKIANADFTSMSEQEIITWFATNGYGTLNDANAFKELTSGSVTVPAGYYLIKDKDNTQNTGETTDQDEKSYTLFILEVVENYTITPKASVPEVKKTVDDINDSDGTTVEKKDSADYDIGDNVPFHLSATLADNVSQYKKYHITFVDTLEAGKWDAISTPVIKLGNTTLPITDGAATGYTASVTYETAASTSGFTVTIEFTPAAKTGEDAAPVQLPTVLDGAEVTVDFTAKLGTGATIGQVGNVNTVQLEYSNNPNDAQGGEEGKTPEDTVIVFTYEVVVDKVDEDGTALGGAAFKLYKKYKDEATLKAAKGDNATAASIVDSKGEAISKYANAVYYEVAATEALTATTTSFDFKGLDDGDYVLVETTVPTGYNPIDPIEFTVTGTHTETADINKDTHKDPNGAYILTGLTVDNEDLTASVDGTATVTKVDGSTKTVATGNIYGEIVNKSGATLPETGGRGVIAFYVIGGILVLGAGIVLVSKRRMVA